MVYPVEQYIDLGSPNVVSEQENRKGHNQRYRCQRHCGREPDEPVYPHAPSMQQEPVVRPASEITTNEYRERHM